MVALMKFRQLLASPAEELSKPTNGSYPTGFDAFRDGQPHLDPDDIGERMSFALLRVLGKAMASNGNLINFVQTTLDQAQPHYHPFDEFSTQYWSSRFNGQSTKLQ